MNATEHRNNYDNCAASDPARTPNVDLPENNNTDHHDHDHDHSHGPSLARAGERHRSSLLWAIALVGGFMFVEAVTAVLTGSLALLSDAAHMFTDVLGLTMAYAAITLATKRSDSTSKQNTFGLYRLEILAAFMNAILLSGVAVWVIVEGIGRIRSEPEVVGTPMLIVAVLGLIVNIAAFFVLRRAAKDSLNMEGAYLEVLADMVGSVGAITAGLLVKYLGWHWADPAVALALGLWILPRTIRLGKKAAHVLLQSAPAHIDITEVHTALAAVPNVANVHDLHVWTLTSEMDTASAHIQLVEGADGAAHQVLDDAHRAAATFGISHATFQVEPHDHASCHELIW